MNRSALADHLTVDRYGDFLLTAAVRPGLGLPVVPRQGYRRDRYRDEASGRTIPVLLAAVSREAMFDVFLSLLEPLGPVVDVVLETSHDTGGPVHRDLSREEIELPVLASHLCDYEELLTEDGFTGVAVIGRDAPLEVQFDEHKLFAVYADRLEPFESILRSAGVRHVPGLRLITEGEHYHGGGPGFQAMFERLRGQLGAGESARSLSW